MIFCVSYCCPSCGNFGDVRPFVIAEERDVQIGTCHVCGWVTTFRVEMYDGAYMTIAYLEKQIPLVIVQA